MKIYLRDKNPAIVNSWEKFFRDAPDVEVSCGDIFGLNKQIDAIVSPSNSFCYLDGGIDFFYSMRWPHAQKLLQDKLLAEYYGELPVGMATFIDLNDPEIKWLISAPTMRVPMDVRGTVNAYLAFRAALIVAKENNINSVLCPGMGTAIGMLEPDIAAMQMYFAYKMILHKQATCYNDIGEAWNSHEILRRGVM